MGLKVCVLGSGSTGNCIFVAGEKGTILIDMGLPAPRVEKCLRSLKADPDETEIILTHCHSDHTSGLDAFCSRHESVRLHCTPACFPSIFMRAKRAGHRMILEPGDFFVGDVTVSPFPVSHDVPCVGYSLLCGGTKVSVATDLGKVTPAVFETLADSDLVILESNHDLTMLRNNPRYSDALKRRIMSDKGHLSNVAATACIKELIHRGVKQLILAHLSRENNYPELAFQSVISAMQPEGLVEGDDYELDVAYPDRMTGLFEIY